jgi:hypothetical protein
MDYRDTLPYQERQEALAARDDLQGEALVERPSRRELAEEQARLDREREAQIRRAWASE